jgi:hypothetical protein
MALLQPLSKTEAREALADAVRAEVRSERPDWVFVARLSALLARGDGS